MNKATPLAIWAYLVAAALVQVSLATLSIGLASAVVIVMILGLGATEIGGIAAVFMHLRWEPKSVVAIAAASVFFAVLAVVLFLGSIGH